MDLGGRSGSVALLAMMVVATMTSSADCRASERSRADWIRAAAAEIDADRIRRHVVVLGGDALEGRGPGSPGGRRAARYIAQELEAIGAVPLGDDGGFEQTVPLLGSVPLAASRLRITDRGDVFEPVLGEDYLLYTTGSETCLPRPLPMVFVGYGIIAPEYDYNDYADVDVDGRVVVFLDGEPRSEDPHFFDAEQPTIHSSLESKVRTALARGAAGSLMVPIGGVRDAAGWEALRREYAHEHMILATSLPRHFAAVVEPFGLGAALFDSSLYDLDRVRTMDRAHTMRSFHLKTTLTFAGVFRQRSFLASNVVGMIEGVGRRRADSAIVLSAHHDHLGVGPAVDGDRIYNGVVDNAVGVAVVLEIARVLAEARFRPSRSVIVLFPSAEERGNLGSRFFLEHPPVPLIELVANVNVDGVAFRAAPEDVIGVGAEQSTLADSLRRAARAVGVRVSRPPEGVWSTEAFVRSDQAVFAEHGIPALLVTQGFSWRGWTPEDAVAATVEWLQTVYHMPSDDLRQPLDFEAMARHARVILAVVVDVGEHPVAPEWLPGAPAAYIRALQRARRSEG